VSELAVILPFRNASATLERAIGSLLNQSFKEFELILINDHSSDNSLAVINKINDQRIRLIENKGTGLAAALNTGIKLTNARYIARMDADDISLPDRLKLQYEFAVANPDVDVVSCLVQYVKSEEFIKNTEGYNHHVQWLNEIRSVSDHFQNRFADSPIAHPTLFCRKTVFEKYGYYSEDELPEDFELWLRWFAKGVKFIKLPQELYQWYDYPQRLSRVHPNYTLDKFHELKAAYFAQWWHYHQRPNLWVWGYGKEVFKRSAYLAKYKVQINGYVDLKKRPQAKRTIISYKQISKTLQDFYLVYVSDRQGKENIKQLFAEKGMLPDVDYYFMT